jgi:hypothetical protein
MTNLRIVVGLISIIFGITSIFTRAFLKSREKEQKRTFIGYVKGIKPKPNQGRSK